MATVCLSDIMVTMPDFKEKINHDEQYQILLKTVHKKSFADNKKAENDIIKDFFHVKDRLSLSDYLVLYSFEGGDLRLVIPKELRTQIIRNLHTAHQGVDSILSKLDNPCTGQVLNPMSNEHVDLAGYA